MSRLVKVVIALLAIAAIATPVMAEDRLSLAGQMRVRGFFLNSDNGTTDQSSAWNDQRLRLQGKIAVAEGVSVVFRTDATEAVWGSSAANVQNTNRMSALHFDKAYLQLVKNGYTLLAGQQYYKLGLTGMLADTIGAGFTIKKGPVTLVHLKVSDLDTQTSDASVTGAQFNFGNDDFSGSGTAVYNQGTGSDVDLVALGVVLKASFGAVAVKGEVDFLSGENAAGNDEKGLQLYVDVSSAISDTVTVGGLILWAQSQDGTDDQVTRSGGVFADWRPLAYGYESVEFSVELDPFELGGAGTNSGIRAISGYADVKVSDDLGLKFAAAYAQSDDDDVLDIDGFTLNASLKYAVMANTSLTAHAQYQGIETAGVDTDTVQIISGLAVKF